MSALIFCAIAVMIHLLPGLAEQLQWTRASEGIGTLWTAHFTHWSAGHLFWDALMLVVFGLIAARHYGLRLLPAFLLAAPLITLGVGWASPELTSYRGLSGFDTLLFVYVGVRILSDAKQPRTVRAISALLLTGLVGKTGFEAVTGSALFVQDLGPGVVAAPVAHLIGGLLGFAMALGAMVSVGLTLNLRRLFFAPGRLVDAKS